MKIDLDYLRKHYASLADESLLELDRSDLVEAAQQCYDAELRRRGLTADLPKEPAKRVERAKPAAAVSARDYVGEGEPDWMDQATEVISWSVSRGQTQMPGQDFIEALGTAGIPCHLDMSEIEEEVHSGPKPTHVLRLLVPAQFNLEAASVLERDLSNQGFEEAWRTHLESLSDEELTEAGPEVTFCGLFDRVERVTSAYREELDRRGIKLGSPSSKSAT